MDVEQRIRGYLGEFVDGLTAERVTAVRRFPAGERHAVYRVSTGKGGDGLGDVVVRVATSAQARDRAWAEREVAVLTKLDGVGAPRLLDHRWESGWFDAPVMCLQFVAGEQRPPAAVPPADVERLGTVLARLHDQPVDELRPWFAVPAGLDDYVDGRLRSIGGTLPSTADPVPRELRERLQEAWRSVRGRAGPVRESAVFAAGAGALLHGDVGPANIVWGAAPVLIDWEYARIGDPADEIAHYFGENEPDDSQRAAFWRGYARGSTAGSSLDRLVDRVRWWEPVTLLGSALWWVGEWSRAARPGTGGGRPAGQPAEAGRLLHEASRRLDRLEQLPAG